MEDKIKILVENRVITQEVADKYEEPFTIFSEEIIDQLLGVDFYPEPKNMFRALNECPNPKVVILGQDPYHDGSATGLAFDNDYHSLKKMSPSLRNILEEMIADIGYMPTHNIGNPESFTGYLDCAARQGVLLINTALTVEPGKAGSHTKLWAPFTESLLKKLQEQDNIVWILWGNHAKAYKKFITNSTHHILEGTHPMPLAANRGGFFEGKYFSKTNEFLRSTNQEIINW